jgi:hypothetical protein
LQVLLENPGSPNRNEGTMREHQQVEKPDAIVADGGTRDVAG